MCKIKVMPTQNNQKNFDYRKHSSISVMLHVLGLPLFNRDIQLEYRDLEARVRGHSRSSKIIPFNPAPD